MGRGVLLPDPPAPDGPARNGTCEPMRRHRVTRCSGTHEAGPIHRANRVARWIGRVPATLLACAVLGAVGRTPPADRNAPSPPGSGQVSIADRVRECMVMPAGLMHRLRASVEVTTDAAGVARIVRFGDDDLKRMGNDPDFRDFARRVTRAVLDPRCATWPLPRHMLGRSHTFRLSVESRLPAPPRWGKHRAPRRPIPLQGPARTPARSASSTNPRASSGSSIRSATSRSAAARTRAA